MAWRIYATLGGDELSACSLVTSYDPCTWLNIGTGNELMPDGTKPLPETMLTSH